MKFRLCLYVVKYVETSFVERRLIISFPKQQILDSFKLKEFADDNFIFDENERKVIQTGRKQCGKKRNCSSRAIFSFPTVFPKDLYCR